MTIECKDIPVGTFVKFEYGPVNDGSDIGEVVKVDVALDRDCSGILVRVKGGWTSQDQDLREILRITEPYSTIPEFGGWWIALNHILEIVKPAEPIKMKRSGGNCTICNSFNEYQDGPYTCYSHRV